MVGAIQSGSTMTTEMLARMRERMFEKLDSDGDGQIDLTQLQAEASATGGTDNRLTDLFERLSAADSDGDGKVSKTEFEAVKLPEPPAGEKPGGQAISAEMMAEMHEKMFSELDADGDGQIDLAELQTRAEESGTVDDRFSQLLADLTQADSDGDGKVSKAESEAMKPPEPPKGGDRANQAEDISSMLMYGADGETGESRHLAGLLLDTLG